MKVQLKPGLRRAWREPGEVQFGVSSRRGAVLGGLTEDDAGLLARLAEGFDPAQLESGRVPPGPVRGRELIQLLADAGLLLQRRSGRGAIGQLGASVARLQPDAAAWALAHEDCGDGWELLAGRARRCVAVLGQGRLAAALTGTLTEAGVGRVTDGTDAGGRYDLVVLIDHTVADARRADHLMSADVPHLSVVIREDEVVVGPLVRPERGPCLRCLDLHRSDRDPAWPVLLPQLLNPTDQAVLPEESALCVLAAGLAALQVLGQLDDHTTPAAVGATLELELPDGLLGLRRWPAHPKCGCQWRALAVPDGFRPSDTPPAGWGAAADVPPRTMGR